MSKLQYRKTANKPAFVEPKTALVLRTSNSDGTSYGGFKWPELGPVECLDWDPELICGGGLHGLLWGEGDASFLSRDIDAKWHVVEVAIEDIVKIDDGVAYVVRDGKLVRR